ncbi:hypothetical protein KQX54_018393 [Cotesia glomerata]|uniref:Uncharacterized protein n=1 Tax=Cotesia glomerata TaxID=32391 RepID=A0AAV7HT81_COTGL|nr:hypothetical protein KQX54_018393 [Cotesia glomerata]
MWYMVSSLGYYIPVQDVSGAKMILFTLFAVCSIIVGLIYKHTKLGPLIPNSKFVPVTVDPNVSRQMIHGMDVDEIGESMARKKNLRTSRQTVSITAPIQLI